jgi:hypothetical protein
VVREKVSAGPREVSKEKVIVSLFYVYNIPLRKKKNPSSFHIYIHNLKWSARFLVYQ